MQRKKRSQLLSLEFLEDRTCPTLIEQFISGSLYISGTPTAAPGQALSIAHVGASPTMLQVKDGNANLGTFNVTGNLQLNLTHYNSNIDINLTGGRLGGNLVANLGTGSTNLNPIANAVNIHGGSIGGTVNVLAKSGNEILNIGSDSVAVASPITIGGDVSVTDAHGSGKGNTLSIFDGTTVGGSVSTNSVDAVQIGSGGAGGTFIGKDLSVNDYGSTNQTLNVLLFGNDSIGGNVNLTGTPSVSVLGDRILLFPNSVVEGNLTSNLGDGFNSLQLQGAIFGSVNSVEGSGTGLDANALFPGSFSTPANLVSIVGTVNGSVAATFGNASSASGTIGNEFALFSGAVISGNLTVTAGNGVNSLNGDFAGAGGFSGEVDGSIAINLGNGSNSFALTPGANVNGNVTYRGGSGSNTVSVDGQHGINLNVRFAPSFGVNSFTYGAAAAINSGYIDFGAHNANNSFIDLAPIFWPNTIVNL